MTTNNVNKVYENPNMKTEEENAKRLFEQSIKAAEECGVPYSKILKSKKDIDSYFG